MPALAPGRFELYHCQPRSVTHAAVDALLRAAPRLRSARFTAVEGAESLLGFDVCWPRLKQFLERGTVA